MLTLGFDPDLHTSGVAILDGNNVLMVALISTPLRVKGSRSSMTNILAALKQPWPMDQISRAAIEVPQMYGGGRNQADPNDLLNLALVAGGAASTIGAHYPACSMAFVQPRTWKGQVPKKIHHRRLCKELGLETVESGDQVLPRWESHTQVYGALTPARTQHVLDAVGLAWWAQKLGIERDLVTDRS